MPVYLDEISTANTASGTLTRSIALPFTTTAGCVLASGKPTVAPFWWYDSDGWPQLSDNGQYIMFICMAPASLTVAMPDTTATVKRITTVSYAGIIATPATSTITGGGSALGRYSGMHTVSSSDGISRFWISSEPPYYYASGGGGMKYMAAGNTGTGTYISPAVASE